MTGRPGWLASFSVAGHLSSVRTYLILLELKRKKYVKNRANAFAQDNCIERYNVLTIYRHEI